MNREVPVPLVVTILVLVLGVVGFYFYWSNRPRSGAGVTVDEMRREFLQRAKSGQLPNLTPEDRRRLESMGK